jgi:hypothetical protein
LAAARLCDSAAQLQDEYRCNRHSRDACAGRIGFALAVAGLLSESLLLRTRRLQPGRHSGANRPKRAAMALPAMRTRPRRGISSLTWSRCVRMSIIATVGGQAPINRGATIVFAPIWLVLGRIPDQGVPDRSALHLADGVSKQPPLSRVSGCPLPQWLGISSCRNLRRSILGKWTTAAQLIANPAPAITCNVLHRVATDRTTRPVRSSAESN